MRTFTSEYVFKSRFAKRCLRVVETIFGTGEARRLLAKYTAQDKKGIGGWLDVLDISYDSFFEEGAGLPKTGPVVLVANHPSGILDGMMLLDFCLSVRDDVKILARGGLREFDETGRLIIPIPIGFAKDSWDAHLEAKQQAQDFLNAGGVVIVFGAGGMYRWHGMSFTDAPWSSFVGKLSVRPHVKVLPVFLEIQCSWFYKFAGFFSLSVQRMLLLREVLVKRGKCFRIVVGKAFNVEVVEPKKPYSAIAADLRERVFRLNFLLDSQP